MLYKYYEITNVVATDHSSSICVVLSPLLAREVIMLFMTKMLKLGFSM